MSLFSKPFGKKKNFDEQTLINANACPNCWGIYEYDNQFIVEKDESAAIELRSLYSTGKLNFPTILLKGKKLRNPRTEELEKWFL